MAIENRTSVTYSGGAVPESDWIPCYLPIPGWNREHLFAGMIDVKPVVLFFQGAKRMTVRTQHRQFTPDTSPDYSTGRSEIGDTTEACSGRIVRAAVTGGREAVSKRLTRTGGAPSTKPRRIERRGLVNSDPSILRIVLSSIKSI